LIGAASTWGANSPKDAIYLNVTPELNDGKTAYRLTVKDVPVDGFWSVIVYNADGYIPQNDRKVYSFNNVTAKKDADGLVADSVRRLYRQGRQLHPVVVPRLGRPRRQRQNEGSAVSSCP